MRNVGPYHRLRIAVDTLRVIASYEDASGWLQRVARDALRVISQLEQQSRCPHGHIDCCGHHTPEDMPIHARGACPNEREG